MISKLFGKEDEFAWRDVFFKEDFSVDKFLSKNTNKSDLVSLRQGLKTYGTDLHKCMSEILKNETEAIVNLAESLSNLTSKIDDLSKPASQLQEEVRALYEAIKSAKLNFDDHIKKAKSIEDKRDFLNINRNIIATCINVEEILEKNLHNGEIDLLLLERAVGQYSFQKTYSNCKGFNFLQNECVTVVERKLNKVLDDAFVKAVKNNEDGNLERCLRMYVSLNRQSDAETLYKDRFVRPLLSDIFTQKNFELKSQNLAKLYEEAINFLNQNMSNIIAIVKANNDLTGYNFIVNSFWKEIDRLLKDNLPYITAPGNPELFQKRFKSTWRFLQDISGMCGDADIIKSQDTFQTHIKRYNLPVYFEIRFQHIAGRLEKDLLLSTGVENTKTGSVFKLKSTETFWECFQDCFKDDVFIEHLASQFVKLSMLLLSRFLRWVESVKNNVEAFSVSALVDLQVVKTQISTLYHSLTTRKECEVISLIIDDITTSNNAAIDASCVKFQDNLIQLKLQESLNKLQDVTAVPRLYRRTNRVVPTEPSTYMISAVNPVVKFHEHHQKQLGDKTVKITNILVEKMSENYLSLVQEVLHSVGKTEKSLQRLKNRNLNTNKDKASAQSDLTSDEGKIREQIRLDIDYFSKKLQPFTTQVSQLAINNLTKELKSVT